jgi:cytidine deaminase
MTPRRPPLTKQQESSLVAAARAVRRRAYAPHSGFTVGAAVLDERGRIHQGCNVENASYGLTVCAERNAVAAAVAAGARHVHAVAIVGPIDPPVRPCGACRQVLAEFARPETPVLLAPARGRERATARTLGELLPESFRL